MHLRAIYIHETFYFFHPSGSELIESGLSARGEFPAIGFQFAVFRIMGGEQESP
jgi:hypothetical protein